MTSPCAAPRHTAKSKVRRVQTYGSRRSLTALSRNPRPLTWTAGRRTWSLLRRVVVGAHGELNLRRVLLFRRVFCFLRTAYWLFVVCSRNSTWQTFSHTVNSRFPVAREGAGCSACSAGCGCIRRWWSTSTSMHVLHRLFDPSTGIAQQGPIQTMFMLTYMFMLDAANLEVPSWAGSISEDHVRAKG